MILLDFIYNIMIEIKVLEENNRKIIKGFINDINLIIIRERHNGEWAISSNKIPYDIKEAQLYLDCYQKAIDKIKDI